MTERHPALQQFGPRHALSFSGLQVRDGQGMWKLAVPMSPPLLESVRALCERLTSEQAAAVLALIERYLRADFDALRAPSFGGGVDRCC